MDKKSVTTKNISNARLNTNTNDSLLDEQVKIN